MEKQPDFIRLANEIVDKLNFCDKKKYELAIEKMGLEYLRQFDFLPDMLMTISRFSVKESFTEIIGEYKGEERLIAFSFTNVVNAPDIGEHKTVPYIAEDKMSNALVFAAPASREVLFRKGRHRQIVIWVNRDFLLRFLKEDAAGFDFLFNENRNFLIDEILTDDLLRILNEIATPRTDQELGDFYFKLKALELLFSLFMSLKKRTQTKPLKLTEANLKAVYQVRDKITSSLTEFCSVEELKKTGGMNELKLRRLFMQVFGKGFFEYFQQFRMSEAARLLREEKLSVSEAGYRVGFENLSHFSRVFKQYIGDLPKRYAKTWTDVG